MAGYTEWLLIGGPGHGKKLSIKAGRSVLYPVGLEKFLYAGREFFWKGKCYKIGVNADVSENEIQKLIVETELLPIDPI